MTASKFEVGDLVILQNLKIHPEFNGLETTVTAPWELRKPLYGVERLPLEYLYEVDIQLAGYEPGLLVSESQMRHRRPPPEWGRGSLIQTAVEGEPDNRIEGLQEVVKFDGGTAGTNEQLRVAAPGAPPTPRVTRPQHCETERPITLECWQGWLLDVDATTTFHEYPSTLRGALRISNELQRLVDDFGEQTLEAVFAVRHGIVEGVWLDLHHNYVATIFTKASGDPEDCVLINSLG